MDYRNQSLGALAIAIPRASKLFRDYDLDFCCGGNKPWSALPAAKNWIWISWKVSWPHWRQTRWIPAIGA